MYSDQKHIRNKRINLSLSNVKFQFAEATDSTTKKGA